MALRFVDGFDYYTASQITHKWTFNNNSGISTNFRRSGSGSLFLDRFSSGVGIVLDNQPTWIVGMAFYTQAFGNSEIIKYLDGTTEQVSMRIDANGRLSINRGGTVLAQTSSQVLFVNTWYYIEFKATIHGSAGSASVRVNGVTVLSVTNVDTNQTANNFANRINIGLGSLEGGDAWVDDLYICDGTGTINNDFLGDVKVETLYPSGAGASTQWTPTGAANNWDAVDDTTPDSDTTYVSSATAGQKDLYAVQDLTTTSGAVYGAQVSYYARKDDAGSRSVRSVVRSGGGAEATGATRSIGDSYLYYMDVFETEPGGASWDIARINAMQVGVELVS